MKIANSKLCLLLLLGSASVLGGCGGNDDSNAGSTQSLSNFVTAQIATRTCDSASPADVNDMTFMTDEVPIDVASTNPGDTACSQ